MTNQTDPIRSATMRAVKSKDTGPEILVRRLVHRMGYRFRLHLGDLPGKPDMVFPGRHKIIFIHGCFWHGHDCIRGRREPKTNTAYWSNKIARNRERHIRTVAKLNDLGWDVLTLWECELAGSALTARIDKFLSRAH
jgi:DNA mismatch endonuclease, patch repair protein